MLSYSSLSMFTFISLYLISVHVYSYFKVSICKFYLPDLFCICFSPGNESVFLLCIISSNFFCCMLNIMFFLWYAEHCPLLSRLYCIKGCWVLSWQALNLWIRLIPLKLFNNILYFGASYSYYYGVTILRSHWTPQLFNKDSLLWLKIERNSALWSPGIAVYNSQTVVACSCGIVHYIIHSFIFININKGHPMQVFELFLMHIFSLSNSLLHKFQIPSLSPHLWSLLLIWWATHTLSWFYFPTFRSSR